MTEKVVSLRPTKKVGGVDDTQRVETTRSDPFASRWFVRPDDRKFATLTELYAHSKKRADLSWVDVIDLRAVRVVADIEDPLSLTMELPNAEVVEPTHFAFGELCKQMHAPASYLRTRPGPIAAFALQHDLIQHTGEMMKVLATKEQRHELRGVTSPDYRRTMDASVLEAMINVAAEGGWKIPLTLNASTEFVDKRSTGLYSSDRDVFVFLIRDQFPIEIGRLSNGAPDILYPGLVVSSSETGARKLSLEMIYLRGGCQNRNFWGISGQKRLRYPEFSSPERFAAELIPVLEGFVNDAARPVIIKTATAKNLIVARNDDERRQFLAAKSFPRNEIKLILDIVAETEGHPAASVWDFVQGIASWARDIPRQDERVSWEHRAGLMMEKIA